MHLLLVTSSYPFLNDNAGKSAAGVFVRDYAKEIVKLGHEVSVVAPSLTCAYTIEDGVNVHRFTVPFLPLASFKLSTPQHLLNIYKVVSSGQKVVNDVCKKNDINHIFALWVLPCGHWAKRASKKFNIPYSTWALGSDIWSLGKLPVIKNYLGKILKSSTNNFADGLLLAEDTKEIGKTEVKFLPSSRSLNMLREKTLKTAPPYNLVFLGRWHKNKGVDLLLEALFLLGDSDWLNIESIYIAGGGVLETLVHNKVQQLIDKSRPIKLLDYLNQIDATNLLLKSDYLIIPSRIESIPVIFSDAMQTKCPIVTTPVGDLEKLIETYKVGICSNTSSEGIKQGIQQILAKSPKSFEHSLSSCAADFDISQSAEKLLASLKQ